jgi:MFS family permease
MRGLLRDRSYLRLLLGQTMSAFGDYAMFLALAVWVKVLTGSNAAAGLSVLPFIAPSLAGPALGVFVDRFPRRRMMIWTDLAAAASLVPLLWVRDAGDIWLIYVASFLLGLATVVYQAARSGLLVSMLAEDALGEANGLLQSTSQAMRLLAPLGGAALFAWLGGPAVAALDAATFVVSALLLIGVRAPTIERSGEEQGFWPELRAGIRHIARTTDLRRLTIVTAFVTLAAGVMEIVIFALIDEGLHQPPTFLGVLSTAQGVGAVAGGVVVAMLMRRIGELWTIAWALVAIGVGVGLLATAELAAVLIAIVFVGLAVSFYNVAFVTLVQRRTSLAMQGRVMSAIEAAFTVPYAASIAFGAAIVTVVDFRVIYVTQAVAFLLVAVYVVVSLRSDATPPTPSRGRSRRRARGRSSSPDGRGPAAPPPRSEDPRPTH